MISQPRCQDCGYTAIVSNSCRNRQSLWIARFIPLRWATFTPQDLSQDHLMVIDVLPFGQRVDYVFARFEKRGMPWARIAL